MMWKYLSVAEMVSVEKAADKSGISYAKMMENAGKGLARVVNDRYGGIEDKQILGLVGKGNNGGDTLVALCDLAERGWEIYAYVVGGRDEGDELMTAVMEAGGEIIQDSEDKGYRKLKGMVKESAVIMDGLLGTGIRLPLRKPMPKVLKAVKEALDEVEEQPVVAAVDCPSGIDCDSGEAAKETITADITVCMGAVKQGLLALPAFGYVGELVMVGIGLPEGFEPLGKFPRFMVDRASVNEILPKRPLDGHKGTFGTVLIAAGSVNYTGAALLSGEAAYRSGAGLVTMAVPGLLYDALAGVFPEATWLLLPHELGVISEDAARVIKSNLGRVTCLLVGPGFGLEDVTRDFLERLLMGEGTGKKRGLLEVGGDQDTTGLPPMVVDADGLKLLCQIDGWEKRLPELTVLTPHPGEMAVMTGLGRDEIQENRIKVAEEYAKKWGHVVVLKGAFTIAASPDGRTAVIPIASPALARAGTGDVLAGLIAGLKAQGMEGFEAATAGTWLHGRAGIEAAKRLGSTAGVVAGDLLDEISKLMPW